MMNQSLPGFFQRSHNVHAYLYKKNFLVGFNCRIIYEVIILKEPKKKTHLNVCYPSLHLLWQPSYSLNTVIPSSAELICFAIENILMPPHLKQVYNKLSRISRGFSSCLITRFTFSLAESKPGCSKIGSMFVSILFVCALK